VVGKPLIGLNADYRDGSGETPAFTYIAAGYYEAITRAGGIPVILPPQANEADINRALDAIDGLVLVGGGDLDPRQDGFMLHPTVRPLAKQREKFDRTLARLAAARKLPLLGIGVGMQLINLTMGGNLFLHLPEDMPHALPHRDPLDPAHRHGLEVTSGTVMERVYGEGEIRVNSMHHMAIDELATCFRVSARCPDGVIEAIESIDMDDWFVVATQFHPETSSASALDVGIFEEFMMGVSSEEPQIRMVA